ncbi:unnamed protein product [Haemonchus placei]|uniref:Uncharacterized protein n=1 Tax=Haemonchus placei TaxID=6290 RepID=A0A0N4WM12_HAEPC|nr:unnamed protein product [Haemonchus placei]
MDRYGKGVFHRVSAFFFIRIDLPFIDERSISGQPLILSTYSVYHILNLFKIHCMKFLSCPFFDHSPVYPTEHFVVHNLRPGCDAVGTKLSRRGERDAAHEGM